MCLRDAALGHRHNCCEFQFLWNNSEEACIFGECIAVRMEIKRQVYKINEMQWTPYKA
jgi:hypothetical protein